MNKVKATSPILRIILRITVLILYSIVFMGLTTGLYLNTAKKESQKTIKKYTENNKPDCFPVLVDFPIEGKTINIEIQYLNNSEYIDSEWKLYQKPGEGNFEGKYDVDDGRYVIEKISDTRKQVTLYCWVGGGDGEKKYVYEVEENRVYPRFYQLRHYFGWMFSSLPTAFITTIILIIFSELFLVRRAFKFLKRRVKDIETQESSNQTLQRTR